MTMNTSARFASLDAETAPPAVRPILLGSTRQFGFLPSPVAKAAHSPALLKHLMAGFAAFDGSSLSALEREVVAITVAFEMGCDYCMALHSALLAGKPENVSLLERLRAGSPLVEPKLEALRGFALELVRCRGRVAAACWEQLE